MKLSHASVERIDVSPPGLLEIEVCLAADAPSEVVAELMLDPHRGVSFVRDGRRTSAVRAELYAAAEPARERATLSFTLDGEAAGGEPVPLLVRFDPREDDPDEIYLEITLPRPSK